jgi:hypothetical protein
MLDPPVETAQLRFLDFHLRFRSLDALTAKVGG